MKGRKRKRTQGTKMKCIKYANMIKTSQVIQSKAAATAKSFLLLLLPLPKDIEFCKKHDTLNVRDRVIIVPCNDSIY